MTILHPTNDSHRISLLRTALESHLRGQTAGRTYLVEATADALDSQATQLETTVQTIAQAQAAHQQALAQTAAAVEVLQGQVRHTWNTVRWQVRWQGVSPRFCPITICVPAASPGSKTVRPGWRWPTVWCRETRQRWRQAMRQPSIRLPCPRPVTPCRQPWMISTKPNSSYTALGKRVGLYVVAVIA